MKQLILAFLFLFCFSTHAETYKVTATRLNVRDTASKNGEIIGKLKQNQNINVLRIDNKWATIIIDGDTGYISSEYIVLNDTENNVKKKEKGKKSFGEVVGEVVVAILFVFIFIKVITSPPPLKKE